MNEKKVSDHEERMIEVPIKVRLLSCKRVSKEADKWSAPPTDLHTFEFGAVYRGECAVKAGLAFSDVGFEALKGSVEDSSVEEVAWKLIGPGFGKALMGAAQFGIYFTEICPPEPKKEEALCRALGAVLKANVPLGALIEALQSLAAAAEKGKEDG